VARTRIRTCPAPGWGELCLIVVYGAKERKGHILLDKQKKDQTRIHHE
jgi:hypothetical protein